MQQKSKRWRKSVKWALIVLAALVLLALLSGIDWNHIDWNNPTFPLIVAVLWQGSRIQDKIDKMRRDICAAIDELPR